MLEHRAPKASTPILHSRCVESKVGRAVHCAPGLVMLTRLLGRNPAVRALTSAATARDRSSRRRAAAKSAAPLNLSKGAPGVHARRNKTAINTATSPVPRGCHFHNTEKTSTQSWVPVVTAAKMAARQICPKAQRIGRARSPLRVGLGHANPTCRCESRFSAPLRARLRAGNLLVREKHPGDSASGGQRTARPTSDRVLTKQNPQRKCG